jgi:hypothetical protein
MRYGPIRLMDVLDPRFALHSPVLAARRICSRSTIACSRKTWTWAVICQAGDISKLDFQETELRSPFYICGIRK